METMKRTTLLHQGFPTANWVSLAQKRRMRGFWALWLLVGISVGSTPAQAKLNVVATTADLAAIAREIGGDAITVVALAKPVEDPHFVDPKPSFIARLNRADVLITGGADLEVGWLPSLLDSARNVKLAPGAPGLVLASKGVRLLEAPATLDRSRGDVHAMGNPHFMADPLNARIAAEQIASAMSKLDRGNARAYQARLAAFTQRLDEKLREWQKTLGPFAGARLAAYHNLWPYFAQRFRLRIDLFLEPKPGIPPTPAHLASVISTMKQEQIKVVIIEPFQHRRTAESVARATGGVILSLTQYPGGIKGTEGGYIELMDFIVGSLARALAAAK